MLVGKYFYLLLLVDIANLSQGAKSNVFEQSNTNEFSVANYALDFLKSSGQHTDMQTFKVQKVVLADDKGDGNTAVHMKRYYKGLYVMGGELALVIDSNYDVVDTFSSLDKDQEIMVDSIVPMASKTEAAQAAQDKFGGSVADDSPELIIHARGISTSDPVLAYHVKELQGKCSDETPADFEVILDANNLKVLESWNNVNTFLPSCQDSIIIDSKNFLEGLTKIGAQEFEGESGTDATGIGFHNGEVSFVTIFDDEDGLYKLVDPRTGNNRVADFWTEELMSDEDNIWDGINQTTAVDVHYGIKETNSFFERVFNRRGFIGNGVGSISYVNLDWYVNAFFTTYCMCFVFGDGAPGYAKPLTSIDIVGHEWAHALDTFTSMLVYSGESGGLDEASGDIFGTAVKYFSTGKPPNYLIGDDIFYDEPYLRTMIQPSDDRVSADCYFPGLSSLDVHFSSGVANHFFYLLAEGTTNGSPSRTCNEYDSLIANGYGTMTGIGIEKATAIWYRAQTYYFTPSTTYRVAFIATVRAAAELFGPTSAATAAVNDAWYYVNVY